MKNLLFDGAAAVASASSAIAIAHFGFGLSLKWQIAIGVVTAILTFVGGALDYTKKSLEIRKLWLDVAKRNWKRKIPSGWCGPRRYRKWNNTCLTGRECCG